MRGLRAPHNPKLSPSPSLGPLRGVLAAAATVRVACVHTA
jgi:hypothetical protein